MRQEEEVPESDRETMVSATIHLANPKSRNRQGTKREKKNFSSSPGRGFQKMRSARTAALRRTSSSSTAPAAALACGEPAAGSGFAPARPRRSGLAARNSTASLWRKNSTRLSPMTALPQGTRPPASSGRAWRGRRRARGRRLGGLGGGLGLSRERERGREEGERERERERELCLCEKMWGGGRVGGTRERRMSMAFMKGQFFSLCWGREESSRFPLFELGEGAGRRPGRLGEACDARTGGGSESERERERETKSVDRHRSNSRRANKKNERETLSSEAASSRRSDRLLFGPARLQRRRPWRAKRERERKRRREEEERR